MQRLVLVMLVILANPKFKSRYERKSRLQQNYVESCKITCQLWQNLQTDEQPRTMECPVRYFKVAGEPGTVLCRIARWECLGTLLLLFIG